MRAVSVYGDKGFLFELDLTSLDAPYPWVLSCPQSDVEKALTERYRSLGGELIRGTELLDFTQDGAGVRARIRQGADVETVSCDLLVGADGVGSTVRQQLGIGFNGVDYDEHFLLADVDWQGPWRSDSSHGFLQEDGLLIALPGLSARRRWRAVNRVYVETVRAVPILVLILWVYYGLPVVAGITIGVFWAGVIALALSDSAFQAEIFRAGIQSIARGQIEAAQSLSLTYYDTMRYVVLPQALRRILPPLGNQLVYMLKMSSLVSVIGMQELTRKANELVVSEYRPLEIYTFLVLEYLILILIVSAAVRWLERRLRADERL